MTWLDRVNAYFAAAYKPNTVGQQVGSWFRSASRWWMEFARNVLVVGTLLFLADKTNSIALKVFGLLTACAMVVYIYSFHQFGRIDLFPYIKDPKRHRWTNGIAWVAISTALFFLAFKGFEAVTDALSKVTSR